MRIIDLLALIAENLGRRKARVALTAIGVVIGTAAVVVLVSLGIGLQQSFNEGLQGIADLRQIDVYPQYNMGGMGGVVVNGGGGGGGEMPTPVPITPNVIRDIKALPGVETVVARDNIQGEAFLETGRLQAYPYLIGVDAPDVNVMGIEVLTGTTELKRGEIILGGEFVNTGFMDPKTGPVYDPNTGMPIADPPDVYGKPIRLVIAKYTTDGLRVTRTVSLRVVGITLKKGGESDYAVYMNLDEMAGLNQWLTGKRVNRDKDGYPQLLVRAADQNEVLDIAQSITDMGYQASSAQQYIQPLNNFYLVLQVIFGGVGAIALLVAAIGIANTMTMAILERTREIGLMKAVGATNRDVLGIFLGEAAGIGFVGGLGGVSLGWVAGYLMNLLAVVYFSNSSSGFGFSGTSSAVVTPAWLVIGSLVFATFIGLLSGLYPALRAATLVPVIALKTE